MKLAATVVVGLPLAGGCSSDDDSAPTPEDYLEYLLSQEEHGATFADQTDTTVGGLPATLLTATVEEPLDGDRLTLARDESLGISPTPWVMGPGPAPDDGKPDWGG